MAATSITLGSVLLLASLTAAVRGVQPSAAPDGTRLVGLERLHFEPFDPDAFEGRCGEELRFHLAATLPEEEAVPPRSDQDLACDDFASNRYPLPLGDTEADSTTVLVQAIAQAYSRSRELYWCLYADRRRSDCWHYSPSSSSARGKTLANLTLRGARERDDGLVLDVVGLMVRPQGAFWQHRADLVFELTGSELRPDFVVRRFLVGRGYDRFTGSVDRPEDFEVVVPPHYAATERLGSREDGTSIAIERRLDEVWPEDFARCGDPEQELAGGPDAVEELVRCLTNSERAVVRERLLDEPTFLERDWIPPAEPPR